MITIVKVNLVDGRELFLRATQHNMEELTAVMLDTHLGGWLALETFRDGTMIIAIRDISTVEIEEAPIVQ